MKKHTAHIVLLLASAMLFTLVGCKGGDEGNTKMDNNERNRREMYSRHMHFDSHKDVSYAANPKYRDDYSGIAFVHNEEDAEGFPDDVIAAWPSTATLYVVNELNREIVRKEIDLEPHSLQYPLTIETMVDDWEKVYDLWMYGMTPSSRGLVDEFTRNRYRGEMYTRGMHFASHKEIGTSIHPWHRFVYNEEEAEGFSDRVFVAWPTELTLYVLHELNEEIVRMDISLESSSLQYPITIEDMVDDWAKVFDLWAYVMTGPSRDRIDEEAQRKYREDYGAVESIEASGG